MQALSDAIVVTDTTLEWYGLTTAGVAVVTAPRAEFMYAGLICDRSHELSTYEL